MQSIQNKIREILTKYRTVAVVGLSRNSEKYSYKVSDYLKKHDFQIIPVNPSADKILGERSYKSLLDIPERIQKIIEIVNVFRPSEEVLKIVEQVIELKNRYEKPNVIWLQLGIASEKAAEIAKKAGLTIVMDKCIMIEHMRLLS